MGNFSGWNVLHDKTVKNTKKRSFIVGSLMNGHTNDDCDYLCNGINDQDIIQYLLYIEGGVEIDFLPGNYYILGFYGLGVGSQTILRGLGKVIFMDGAVTPSDASGIIELKGNDVVIENITFKKSPETTAETELNGILMGESRSNVKIVNCSFENLTKGVGFLYSSYYGLGNYYIGNNTFKDCKYGVSCPLKLNSDHSIHIVNNNFNNVEEGADVCGDRNLVTNNSFYNSKIGIYLYESEDSIVSNNNLIECDIGIKLSGSDKNNIVNNLISRSSYTDQQYTIQLDGTVSDYNMIANNMIYGKNYFERTNCTGNTFVNNKYN